MDKKFKDLTAEDNIETISSVLKSELEKYKNEYNSMKSDGIIDDQELNRIITTMQDLEFKARSLKEQITSENEKQVMEEIINIINSEQVNMINIKNSNVKAVVEENNKEL